MGSYPGFFVSANRVFCVMVAMNIAWTNALLCMFPICTVDNCPWDAKYALERFWRSIACADEVRSGLVLNSRTSVSELVTSVVLHGLLLFGGF